MLGIINPVLDQRIDWLWFVLSQVGFGIVAGIVVSRQERVRTWQNLPFAVRPFTIWRMEGKPVTGGEVKQVPSGPDRHVAPASGDPLGTVSDWTALAVCRAAGKVMEAVAR